MESHYLIDKEELLNFPTEEYSGFCNFVYDLIQKHDFLDREDDAMNLAEDILDGLMNVIETAEVVEERKLQFVIAIQLYQEIILFINIFVESVPNG